MMRSMLLLPSIVFYIWLAIGCRFSEQTKACRDRKPYSITTYDLEGQWYWVAAQMHSDTQSIKDCTGFRFKKISDTRGYMVVTDSKHVSPRVKLTAHLKGNTIVVPHADTNCVLNPESYSNYSVAIFNDPNYMLCFYACGEKENDDYGSCFSRYTAISDADLTSAKAKFKVPSLIKLNEANFKKIIRENCDV